MTVVIVSPPCPHCAHIVTATTDQACNEGKIDHLRYCRTQRISGGH